MPINYAPPQHQPNFIQFLQQPQLPNVPMPFQDTRRIDHQEALAKAIMGHGLDASPAVGGPGEALARVGQALLGSYMAKRAGDRRDEANAENADALRSALQSGDISGLISSGNDTAEKVGAAILESQMKPRTEYRDLTPEEIAATGYRQRDSNGQLVSPVKPPNTGLPPGYQWNADHTGWEPIPGGPADPNSPKNKQAADMRLRALALQEKAVKAGIADKTSNLNPWAMDWGN